MLIIHKFNKGITVFVRGEVSLELRKVRFNLIYLKEKIADFDYFQLKLKLIVQIEIQSSYFGTSLDATFMVYWIIDS